MYCTLDEYSMTKVRPFAEAAQPIFAAHGWRWWNSDIHDDAPSVADIELKAWQCIDAILTEFTRYEEMKCTSVGTGRINVTGYRQANNVISFSLTLTIT